MSAQQAQMENSHALEARAEKAELALAEIRKTLEAADDLLAGMWSFSEEGRDFMIAQGNLTWWLQASEVIRLALRREDASDES